MGKKPFIKFFTKQLYDTQILLKTIVILRGRPYFITLKLTQIIHNCMHTSAFDYVWLMSCTEILQNLNVTLNYAFEFKCETQPIHKTNPQKSYIRF